MTYNNKEFLTKELPTLLRQLKGDQEPNFGLMSAHHMVEHLVGSTKMFSRRKEKPEDWVESDSVQSFKRFVAKGCPFRYFPSDKTKADLPPLRTQSIAQAIGLLEAALEEMYGFGAENPDYKSFHPSTGEFSMQELDLLIGQHSKWHAYQFGLLANFAPAQVAG